MYKIFIFYVQSVNNLETRSRRQTPLNNTKTRFRVVLQQNSASASATAEVPHVFSLPFLLLVPQIL